MGVLTFGDSMQFSFQTESAVLQIFLFYSAEGISETEDPFLGRRLATGLKRDYITCMSGPKHQTPVMDPSNPIYGAVLRDFRRWSKDRLPHSPGMGGQTETHFPCKTAYAIAVFDHDQERFTAVRVMTPASGRIDWRVAGKNFFGATMDIG
jgi:hypothetical protein